MNIVVVGDGKVGYTLTASLSKEGHDVTVIDNRPDTRCRARQGCRRQTFS